MNILNSTLKIYMPEILDSFSEVYGKKNEELIIEHEKRIIYTSYADFDGAKGYYDFLKTCKINEIAIEYLKKIGVLDSHYELEKSYKKFQKRIYNLLEKYLGSGSPNITFTGEENDRYNLCSFRETIKDKNRQDCYYQKFRKTEQIRYLNNLRDNKEPKITEKNYEEFKHTTEYAELYKKIVFYLSVHQELNEELHNYLEKIEYLYTYYTNETEKQQEIYKSEMLKLYEDIKYLIPAKIREKIEEKNPNIIERVYFLFGYDFQSNGSLEVFSTKTTEDLKNPNTPISEKKSILIERIFFFKRLGANIDFSSYKKYDELIKRDDIKELIPDENLVDKIISAKNKVKNTAKKSYIYQNHYFNNSVNNILNRLTTTQDKYTSEEQKEFISRIKECLYEEITIGNNCVFYTKISETGKNDKIIPILLQLKTKYDLAQMDYIFLHELTHAIEFYDFCVIWHS